MHLIRIGNDLEVEDWRDDLRDSRPYPWRPLNGVRYLAVHHSGHPADSSPLAIHRYHQETLGWPGIGYHFVVQQDGAIRYVGDIMQLRYNVAGRNHEVIGVCLPGDFTLEGPSPIQLVAANRLLGNLQWALGWFVPVVGHREIALPGYGTACPGDTWEQWLPTLRIEAP